jgi:hypoxanthine phosphoribosyltransferase
MALQISKDYEGKEIVCVGLLTGAVCFMTDLCKYLQVPYVVSTDLNLSAYPNAFVSNVSIYLLDGRTRSLTHGYNCVQIDFMTLSSYGKGTKSSGSVNLKKDMSMDPAGKHILV